MRRRNSYSYSYTSSYSRRRLRLPSAGVLVGIAVVLVVLGVLVAFNFKRIKLMHKGYSWKEASTVLDMSDKNVAILLKEDKIEKLDTWMEYTDDASYYDEYDHYAKLFPDMDDDDVVDTMDEFVDDIYPGLEDLNYKDDVIWTLLETQSNKDLKFLVSHDLKYKDIKGYMSYKYFKCSNVLKYEEAIEKYDDEAYAINLVNFPFIISSNASDDDVSYTIENPEDIDVLVKKGFYYSSDYVPDDLRDVEIPTSPTCQYPQLRDEAASALEEMYEDAKEQGYYLVLNSGYRGYNDQKSIYESYEKQYGGLYASEYVATPGASEHQSGLGVDLTSQSVVNGEHMTFGDTAEYQWVLEHAHEYGFIVRFEESKSDITGIAHEPWHLRYIGKKAAKKVYESGLTYEEYCLYNSVLPEIEE